MFQLPDKNQRPAEYGSALTSPYLKKGALRAESVVSPPRAGRCDGLNRHEAGLLLGGGMFS